MITVSGLTKKYGARTVVDDVSFTLEPGTVTGFLGPNGAGKTTTMRMITGLVPATAGSALVDGRPYAARAEPGRGRWARCWTPAPCTPAAPGGPTCGCWPPRSACPTPGRTRCSTWSGSPTPAGRRIGGYSLGMRQRLGIAGALLADPPVLMFDEPANGLDPEGIRWMRGLLRGHAARGGTVLLSSHLLGEVEHTVDRLLVIGGGRIVADGPVASLLGTDGVSVRAARPRRAGGGPAGPRASPSPRATTARWSCPVPPRPTSAPSRPPAVTCSPNSGRCSAAWKTSSSPSPRPEPRLSLEVLRHDCCSCFSRFRPAHRSADRSVTSLGRPAGGAQVAVDPVGARPGGRRDPAGAGRDRDRGRNGEPAARPGGRPARRHRDAERAGARLAGRAVDRGGVEPRLGADDVPARAAARSGDGREGRGRGADGRGGRARGRRDLGAACWWRWSRPRRGTAPAGRC